MTLRRKRMRFLTTAKEARPYVLRVLQSSSPQSIDRLRQMLELGRFDGSSEEDDFYA